MKPASRAVVEQCLRDCEEDLKGLQTSIAATKTALTDLETEERALKARIQDLKSDLAAGNNK